MIRRGFWLVAGAALGVTGYRKASRLARTLTGQQGVPQLTRTADRMPARARLGSGDRSVASPWPARMAAGARSAAGFVRDVREGMAEYHARHGDQGMSGRGSWPDRGGDDGMAGYRALQAEKPGRSLGSQRDRARPGPSQRGPREP